MGERRVLNSTMLLCLEDLGHAILSRLDENSVSALVAGLAGRASLGPSHETAINALVANLEGVHRGIAMATLLI
jgi:hypothetical protein